ncbi:MAG: hypothetical protein H6608_10950 [Flavobacteriales bacterium]|nr:hypothetical protein [Bacteroidota bacterium]MCB9241644.1 hypothetical protein [Flavobacteriales bacterium]
MNKNDKKVITLAVPADIDENYLNEVRQMLLNYKKKDKNAPAISANSRSEATTPIVKAAQPIRETRLFEHVADLQNYLEDAGYDDYKIPKIDNGIYYDEGLTIKKTEEGWETRITQKAG